MRLNCLFWAYLEYRRRERDWVRAGRPIGDEPYWVKRPSRNAPRGLRHRLVGRLHRASGMIEVESFKPDVPTDVPLWKFWRVWTHLLFKGRAERGDNP